MPEPELLAVGALFLTVGIGVWFTHRQDRKKKGKLENLFHGRPRRNDRSYAKEFFAETGIPLEVIKSVRKVFTEFLGPEVRDLEPDDDLSGDYALIWDLDSMADVEILVALEEEFGIEFTDEEAVQLTTLREIAEAVQRKRELGACPPDSASS